MKYAWILSNKAHWSITLACEVLGVSASGYFEHGRRKKLPKPSKPGAHKRMSDEALLTHIRAIHAEVKGEYGWPKMWKELVARGHRVGKERVRRLMQLHGIRARCKRKFVVTTDSKHHLPIAPDLVQRNFTPTAPNQIWTGDITYIVTDSLPCQIRSVVLFFEHIGKVNLPKKPVQRDKNGTLSLLPKSLGACRKLKGLSEVCTSSDER